MAFTYGFYNSKEGSERKYDANQFGKMFDGVITDGVFPYIGECFKVTADAGDDETKISRMISVAPGRGWFNHTWNEVDATLKFKLSVGDATYARYDAVVLQIGCSDTLRENMIYIKEGTPATDPTPPTLERTEGSIYEYVLAYIFIDKNSSSIWNKDITNMVGVETDPVSFTYELTTDTTIDITKTYYQKVGTSTSYIYKKVITPDVTYISTYYEKKLTGKTFYSSEYLTHYAYAVSNCAMGIKYVVISKDDTLWNEIGDDTSGKYFTRSINVTGIDNDAILNADLYSEGFNISEIQKKEDSFSYIFRYVIVNNVLTLYSFYKPSAEFVIRFTGKGVNNN